MKVLVLTNMAPFVWGGAEELTHHLVVNLRLRGLEAEAFRIPFKFEPYERLVDEMFICKSLRLRNVDLVIALKFPAYLVPFENKVFWLLHQYRQAYDLWDAKQSNIPDTDRGRQVRRLIIENDNTCFSSRTKIYVNSKVTASRLKRYNGFDSEVLHPPLNDPELFSNVNDNGYIIAPGRVNGMKRQWLIVDAMRYLPRDTRLIVAGPPDSEEDATRLRRIIAEWNIEDRVKLDLRLIPRRELAELVGRSRCVAYAPVDEDSVSYVAMESFQCCKPVATTSDSGGVLHLVEHEHSGCVAQPDAKAFAQALAYLLENPERARKMGQAGHEQWRSRGINWPTTIDKLLAGRR
ncbi:MAG TPA: glycosyltransferase family 4 protein [Xanthobacteraceae bacterium]|nr:glycosyltransferase family 4 protein [Xanthobacteraceae bacterium]